MPCRRVVEQAFFLRGADIAEAEPDAEAIHLRLGQRIGAGLLHRILGGDDEIGLRQQSPLAIDRHLRLGHGFEQRGLGARRGAIDFVGKQHMGEHRTFVKAEGLGLRVEDGDADDVAGQQVGSELHARKTRLDRARERLGQRRLAGAGIIVEQRMQTGDPGGNDLAYVGILPVQHGGKTGRDGARCFGRGHGDFNSGGGLSSHKNFQRKPSARGRNAASLPGPVGAAPQGMGAAAGLPFAPTGRDRELGGE